MVMNSGKLSLLRSALLCTALRLHVLGAGGIHGDPVLQALRGHHVAKHAIGRAKCVLGCHISEKALTHWHSSQGVNILYT